MFFESVAPVVTARAETVEFGVDDVDETAVGAELNRRVGGEHRARKRVDQQQDVDELVGKQRGVGIVERRAQLERARRQVDLVVVSRQRPGRQLV